MNNSLHLTVNNKNILRPNRGNLRSVLSQVILCVILFIKKHPPPFSMSVNYNSIQRYQVESICTHIIGRLVFESNLYEYQNNTIICDFDISQMNIFCLCNK